jgi:hypothetical protein
VSELPTHCMWCGAPLMGGATVHRADCFIARLQHRIGAELELPADLKVEVEQALGWSDARLASADCECRTCGHRATSHIGGSCFECGREACWS